MKIGEKVSPGGSCYITIEFAGREWTSYCPAAPTDLEVKIIENTLKKITDLDLK